MKWKRTWNVRSRIFGYFLMFTGMLLLLLWLFQVVLLEEFYRMQKREIMRSSAESIVQNIDNENLLTLVNRIAEESSVCILVTDEKMHITAKGDAWNGCIIHHMSPHNLQRIALSAEKTEKQAVLLDFPLMAFKNSKYDERQFRGRVPPSDAGEASSMVFARVAEASAGKRYVFLNTMVTPVSSTVQTIRNELYLISAILVILSFLVSLVLSKRITRPLVETTVAAAALSRGEYEPVKNTTYREIEQLNQQLMQAARDLHRVEEMQHELIANISHDLRTPLTLIKGYAEAVRDLPDEATPENMQVIIDETRRLSTLVNSILELNTARNAAGVLKIAVFDLTATIESMMIRYQKLIEQDGYTIVFEPDEQVSVSADEMRVEQVLYNLINNALTYTGEDKTVVVRQLVADSIIRLEVIDSGEGIAADELPYIWDRYYRGYKPHKRAAIGSGLGLSIVKEILDGHQLPYGVESKPGEGSIFWFELMRAEAKENADDPS